MDDGDCCIYEMLYGSSGARRAHLFGVLRDYGRA